MKSEYKKFPGGLLVGETDKNGGKGIKIVAPEGDITVGGGELVIVSDAGKSNKKHEFDGKEMTPCEIMSEINYDHGGVRIPCDIAEPANTTDSKMAVGDVIKNAENGTKIPSESTEDKIKRLNSDLMKVYSNEGDSQLAKTLKKKIDFLKIQLASKHTTMETGGEIEKSKLKYAKQDIDLLTKEGNMAITDTKYGVLWGEYKNGVYTFTVQERGVVEPKKVFSGNKNEAIEFIKNAYTEGVMSVGGEITTIIPYTDLITGTKGTIDLTKSREYFGTEMAKAYAHQNNKRVTPNVINSFTTDSGAYHRIRDILENIKTTDFNDVVKAFKELYPKSSKDWKSALETGLVIKAGEREGHYADRPFIFTDALSERIREVGINFINPIIEEILSGSMAGGGKLSNGKVNYQDFNKAYGNFYTSEHKWSSYPSSHVMSDIYDEYVKNPSNYKWIDRYVEEKMEHGAKVKEGDIIEMMWLLKNEGSQSFNASENIDIANELVDRGLAEKTGNEYGLTKTGEKELMKDGGKTTLETGGRAKQYYSISSGMKPIGGEIRVVPKRVYYMGASSSPDSICVHMVDDDWITYSKYPHYKTLKIEKAIGENLIAKGSRTFINQWTKWGEKYGLADWQKKTIESLEDNFKGGEGIERDCDDLRRVKVTIKYENVDGDAYSLFERSYPNSLSSMNESTKELISYETYESAKQLIKELKNNPNFKVYKIEEEPEMGVVGKTLYLEGVKLESGGYPKNNHTQTCKCPTMEYHSKLTAGQKEKLGDKYLAEGSTITDKKTNLTSDITAIEHNGFRLKPQSAFEATPRQEFIVPFEQVIDKHGNGDIEVGGYGHTDPDHKLLILVVKDIMACNIIKNQQNKIKEMEETLEEPLEISNEMNRTGIIGGIQSSKSGVIKRINDVNGKPLKKVYVGDILYKINPTSNTYTTDNNEVLFKHDVERIHMKYGGIVGVKEGDNYYRVDIDSPENAKTCRTPKWAQHVADSIKKGAKVTTCKKYKKWWPSAVLVPKDGITSSEAEHLGKEIRDKIDHKKMEDGGVMFETGATTDKVNNLILFADTTRNLTEMRDAIYETIKSRIKKGATPTSDELADRFKTFLLKVKGQYIREMGNTKEAREETNLTSSEDREFMKIYAQDIPMKSGEEEIEDYDKIRTIKYWNGLNNKQKLHFLYDHADYVFDKARQDLSQKELNDYKKFANARWNTLPKEIQMAVEEHVIQGTYKNGGEINGYVSGNMDGVNEFIGDDINSTVKGILVLIDCAEDEDEKERLRGQLKEYDYQAN